MIVLGEGNFWFRFRLFVQFLVLWSMDEKVEVEPEIAKNCSRQVLSMAKMWSEVKTTGQWNDHKS